MIDYNAVYCPWCLTVMRVEQYDAFTPAYATCPECMYEINDDVLTLGQILDGVGDGQEYNSVNLTKWTRFVLSLERAR